MSFNKDVFFLITQLSVIYGGTMDEWHQELNAVIKDGVYTREQILSTWKLLVDNKINYLMKKANQQ